ncbi:hypothetical protein CYMTET_15506 [Cymbomonas tetramitiformis]|uniref:PLAT domain-containing protein n=1 Tax=Cymbomonas tetramitiformis TaxID=36881 RepID=A0AAE0L9A0_9CHLO|nr:hypothetical protein CYMTET_15506 [Cymbomonas tetramitiformis]
MGNLITYPAKKAVGLIHGIFSKLHIGGKSADADKTDDPPAGTDAGAETATVDPPAPTPPKDKTYSVTFVTGKKMFAGTDAKVWYELKGKRDGTETTTGVVEPKQSKGMFEKGKEDKFEITVPDLGAITCIWLSEPLKQAPGGGSR